MMRAAALRLHAQRVLASQRRLASTKTGAVEPSWTGPKIPANALRTWYNIFGKSTSLYVAWVCGLIIVGEYATGKITDALWNMHNHGRTFATVDWSKFDQFGEDEEEDEEEEEEESEDDDDE